VLSPCVGNVNGGLMVLMLLLVVAAVAIEKTLLS
jgi:hypothetical protein